MAESCEELLVVDTDAGADDALAILALLKAEELKLPGLSRTRVQAITCVRGNTDVDNVAANVLLTLSVANRLDIPVLRGASQGLLGGPPTDGYFGEDGFGDFRKAGDSVTRPLQQEHAAVALARMAAESPGKITLVCLGPLTNVALAIHLDSNFLSNIKDVFVLGGVSHGGGNTKAGTEFNVFMDPEAAEVLFRNLKKPAFLISWETVLSLNLSEDWRLNVLGTIDSPAMRTLNLAEKKTFGKREDGLWAPADSLLSCAVLDETLFLRKTLTHIRVVLSDGFARGATLVDFRDKNGLARNVLLLEQPDAERFKALLLSLLGTGSEEDQ